MPLQNKSPRPVRFPGNLPLLSMWTRCARPLNASVGRHNVLCSCPFPGSESSKG